MRRFIGILAVTGLMTASTRTGMLAHGAEPGPQYEFQDVVVPVPNAAEPKLDAVSVEKAVQYLEQGAKAWQGSKNCISCHTNGTYLTVMPALAEQLGPPLESVREHFVAMLRAKQKMEREKLRRGTEPAQVVYLAAGLAEWDARLTRQVSPETAEALALMLSVQVDSGSWGSLDCWPPYESDAFHLATVAAMAVSAVPAWRDQPGTQTAHGPQLSALTRYLQTTEPPHDYGQTLRLWAAARQSDLLTTEQKQAAIDMLWKHQRPDGGWSIRTFAAPEAWGRGNRAERLRAEPDLQDPASDGHQTGLAIIVLREHGIPADDPRLQRGLTWLKTNQRDSGRWWTRSLNTDTFHFITYSGTAFPLRALALCGELPARKAVAAE